MSIHGSIHMQHLPCTFDDLPNLPRSKPPMLVYGSIYRLNEWRVLSLQLKGYMRNVSALWLFLFNSYIYIVSDLHALLVPSTILRSPRKSNFEPDPDLRRCICLYFARIYNCHTRDIHHILPVTMTRWGKVRIANGGD